MAGPRLIGVSFVYAGFGLWTPVLVGSPECWRRVLATRVWTLVYVDRIMILATGDPPEKVGRGKQVG